MTSTTLEIRLARNLRQLSHQRAKTFGDGLFFDPAWQMLLDLYVSEAEQRTLSVSGICVGISAASATSLRYLCLLEDAGFVERQPDPRDRRRSFVLLTDDARRGMTTVLAALA